MLGYWVTGCLLCTHDQLSVLSPEQGNSSTFKSMITVLLDVTLHNLVVCYSCFEGSWIVFTKIYLRVLDADFLTKCNDV
jgi:hypothetical protein